MPKLNVKGGKKHLVAVSTKLFSVLQVAAKAKRDYVTEYVEDILIEEMKRQGKWESTPTIGGATDSGLQEGEKAHPWPKQFILDSHYSKMSGETLVGEELKAANYWVNHLKNSKTDETEGSEF